MVEIRLVEEDKAGQEDRREQVCSKRNLGIGFVVVASVVLVRVLVLLFERPAFKAPTPSLPQCPNEEMLVEWFLSSPMPPTGDRRQFGDQRRFGDRRQFGSLPI